MLVYKYTRRKKQKEVISHLVATGLAPHYVPVFMRIGTNKKHLFHRDRLVLFNHSVATLPGNHLPGFIINMKLADDAQR